MWRISGTMVDYCGEGSRPSTVAVAANSQSCGEGLRLAVSQVAGLKANAFLVSDQRNSCRDERVRDVEVYRMVTLKREFQLVKKS